MLKAALALHHKVLPPSLNFERPNPDIDFAHCPLYVNTELRPWTATADGVRRAGVSAFGFGGTNFHAVLEEYVPHRLTGNGKRSVAVAGQGPVAGSQGPAAGSQEKQGLGVGGSGLGLSGKAPLQGALVVGADSEAALAERLRAIQESAAEGRAPAPCAPSESDLHAAERLAIDYTDAADLADKSAKALKALAANQPASGKCSAPRGFSADTVPHPKWHSSIPARARST